MIIKSMSRKGGGSAPVIKYIFRYMFKEEKTGERSKKESKDKYSSMSKRDLAQLKATLLNDKMLLDIMDKGLERNHSKYFQRYVVPNVGKGEKEIGNVASEQKEKPFVIKHNIRGMTLNQFVRQFEKVEEGRLRRNSRQPDVHHIVLSWHSEDRGKLSEDKIRDLVHKYISLRGEDLLYCGTLHRDRSHFHVHLAQSATTLSGKSSRIGREAFQEVKIKLEEYQRQKYPELSKSMVEHQPFEKKLQEIGQIDAIKRNERFFNERFSTKNSVLQVLETIYPQATSTEHFTSLLKENGYAAYYRDGKLTGLQAEQGQGLKFRFTRLGVDMERLQQLDIQKGKDDKALKELQDLRGMRGRNIERKMERPVNAIEEILLSQEERQLAELREMRGGEREERGVDTGKVIENNERYEPDDVEAKNTDDEKENVEMGSQTDEMER